MGAHRRTPSKRRQQSNGIASLPEVEKFQHLSLQCQKRRPRITFLFALLVILVTLVGVANLFAPSTSNGVEPIIVDGFHPMMNQSHNPQHRPQPKTQGRYHREISVVDHKDVLAQESSSSSQNKKASVDAAPRWTPEQIEEMNRYYKRYLEVFFERHGDEYEPETKEVVYTEYLAFKERKHREHRERKAAEKRAAEQQRQQQQQQQKGEPEGQAQPEENRNGTMDAPSSPIADHIMIKPTPYELEMDVSTDDFDQVGQELYQRASNNATDTMKIVATTPTTIVVSMQ